MHVESLWKQKPRLQENAKHCHYKIPGANGLWDLGSPRTQSEGDSLG